MLSTFQVTITIPISLFSLTESQSQTRACMLEVLPNINSFLEGPIWAMLTKATSICNIPLIRVNQQQKVVYSRWECKPPLLFNLNTRMCDEIRTHQWNNEHMKGEYIFNTIKIRLLCYFS